MSEPRGLLLDVDGTLIDSNWQHALAWSQALQENGYYGIPTATVHHAIGMASDRLLTSLIGSVDDRVTDRHDELLAGMAPHVAALPGVADLLQEAAQAGFATVLVTSADEHDLEWMLPLIGGRSAASLVVTSADVDESKPSPEPFVVALRKAGLPAQRCTVVGDSVWDMRSAVEAGVPAIGLTCGGTPAAELTEAGAAATYADPAALLEQLRTRGPHLLD
ncbi:HAD family hydrolase [Cumulibacter manganitolerans]|uniref:HAD family hydrolase n=1 Tax=Cumulibacter manganitolerans TaxID=1884992 RepID=UPI001295A6C5|nr:HAD family hydrolase [Cumulibacter manganitolerans]